VTATFGKGKWTAEAVNARDRAFQHGYDASVEARGTEREFEALLPPLKRYRLDFIWDGHDYKPTLASAATAKIFANQ
jgi:hypothetical protein